MMPLLTTKTFNTQVRFTFSFLLGKSIGKRKLIAVLTVRIKKSL